jgi:TetR/AcrR family transcriptional regulator
MVHTAKAAVPFSGPKGGTMREGKKNLNAPPKPKGSRNAELTKGKLIRVAAQEFAKHGFGGARTEIIANRAGVNKGLIYHYFRTKENLYKAVLEHVYATIRGREQTLDLTHLNPLQGMKRLIEFSFDGWAKNPGFIKLLNEENLHRAKHIRGSEKIVEYHVPLVLLLKELLHRGARDGVFRRDLDPVQLYLSIASEVYFYFSNAYTLGVSFGHDFLAPEAVQMRRRMIVGTILGYVTNLEFVDDAICDGS